jgi:hypothetical protein
VGFVAPEHAFVSSQGHARISALCSQIATGV